jgi:CoA-transferase family III
VRPVWHSAQGQTSADVAHVDGRPVNFVLCIEIATPGAVCRNLLRQLAFAASDDGDESRVTLRGADHAVSVLIEDHHRAIDTVSAYLVGAHAALVGLGWLRWARHHQTSIDVQLSTLAVVLACLGERLPRAVCDRSSGQRAAGLTRVVACGDGWISVAPLTPSQDEDLERLTQGDVQNWSARRSRAELAGEAQLWRLPVLPVLGRAEAMRTDIRSPFQGGMVASERWPNRNLELPLSDLTILDLGAMWAGPYATCLLAQLGARVIKVESPSRPDGTRPRSVGECSGVFGDLNAGKACVALDLTETSQRAAFERMLPHVDGMVENFSPRVMPNFGLAYPALRARNAGLTAVSMPGFEPEADWAQFVGYGSGIELAAGLAEVGSDGAPMCAPVPFVDYLAGTYGALALLAGVIRRDASGLGCHTTVAQHTVARQLLRTSWRAGDSRRWEPAAWSADELTTAERAPLGVHLRRPAWRTPSHTPPWPPAAAELGADTESVLAELARA